MDEYMNGSTPEHENQDPVSGNGTDSAANSSYQNSENEKPPAGENPAGNEDSVQADNSTAEEAGTAGAAGTYQNQNTGSFSNDSHWGTYEDWNFGNIEAKKEAEEKKQAYAGQSAGQRTSGVNENPGTNGAPNTNGASGPAWNSGAGPSGQNGSAGQPKNGYQSRYDSYRFRTPEDEKTAGTDFMNPSGGPGNGPDGPGRKNRRNRKDRKGSDKGKKIAVIVLLAAMFCLIAVLVYKGVSSLSGGNQAAAPSSSSSSDSSEKIVLGNQDSTESSTGSSVDSIDPDALQSEANANSSSDEELTTEEVVEKVMPSMVAITNTSVEEYQNIYGQTQSSESVSAGSGIIVGKTDDDLLIATNNHVISSASEITVTFVDNSAVKGTIKGTDADNDLAIVAVALSDLSSDTLDQVSVVSIGDSDNIKVGQSVVAIGNALGYGQSVSKGIVSALNREVTDSDGSVKTLIQTDASINPGNSGGALLNMKGELIGINEAKYVDTRVEGVGYAIPMNTAEPILEKLGSKQARTEVSDDQASYIGITCVTMPDSYVQQGYPEGVYVASVISGGPADKAGIKAGDIITSMDGTSVSTKEELINNLKYYAAGEQVEISLSRINSQQNGFDKVKVTVTLGNKNDSTWKSQEAESSASSTSDENNDNGWGFFGR
ncbi:MAG: trypsin-like peptidase domain-containing protein [Eubacteriales bacterium]|jgi:serine protease Do